MIGSGLDPLPIIVIQRTFVQTPPPGWDGRSNAPEMVAAHVRQGVKLLFRLHDLRRDLQPGESAILIADAGMIRLRRFFSFFTELLDADRYFSRLSSSQPNTVWISSMYPSSSFGVSRMKGSPARAG